MSRKDLLLRLNTYYEELHLLNKEIEKNLAADVPSAEKIADLLSRKDFLIEQCMKIKEMIENSSLENDEKEDVSSEQKQNMALMTRMLKEEELNQELMQKVMYKIKEEIVSLGDKKKQIKSYQQNSEKRYGNINKKA